MIMILNKGTPPEDVAFLQHKIRELGCDSRVVFDAQHPVIAILGTPHAPLPLMSLEAYECVNSIVTVHQKYKLASREYHPEDTIVNVGDFKVGGGHTAIIAGPCAVESYEQMRHTVSDLVKSGVSIIRGGVFKPRTSPYDFQGLGREGLDILGEIKNEFKVAVVTEVISPTHVESVSQVADCFQIGARNSQNYNLLEAVAQGGKPVLLKRGMSTTIEEWILGAEYLLLNGCPGVILCERGIRTFEHAARNTLDVTAVAVAKRETHLPVIVDPSHAGGRLDLVLPLARAGIAAGADGVIVESHYLPREARSDATQQIPSADFGTFLANLQPMINAMKTCRK